MSNTVQDHYAIDTVAQDVLFRSARTANKFSPDPVTDEQLHALYDLFQWAPTSANTQPLRVLIVRSAEAKARLQPHIYEMNQPKVESAPAVAILAADHDFHENIPRLLPFRPEMKDMFADLAMREPFAMFNASIQTGYFILAARAAGLAAGPLAGFDASGIDAEFFAGTPLHSVLVVNLGKPAEQEAWFDRLPRLDYDEVVKAI
ncbi:MAG: malonic semialdehyde reductase [Ilumatobacteraceae bacterium]|nr:malonic semialdehyde reductase [Ilumatobacteraceae bacterium]